MSRSIFKRSSWALGFALAFSLLSPAVAAPVPVGEPPMVDGQPARMAVVKKWGRIWYPAPLVGFYRKMNFAYDHARRELYVDGQLSEMETVVVDGIVYLPIKPIATGTDMAPSEASAAAREHLYHSHPHERGRSILETQNQQVHPWSDQAQPVGRVIDLEPTGSTYVPPHMRPGAAPPQHAPEALPGRLPRPGETALVQSEKVPTVQIPPSGGVPRQIQTQGGQPEGHVTGPDQRRAMEPVPYQAPQTVKEPESEKPGDSSFRAQTARNKVFEVAVDSAQLKRGEREGVLTLKLHQTNLSPVAQANLGSFAIRCEDGTRVEPVRSRSYLPGKALGPGQNRQGELIFRLPLKASPRTLELEGTLPLSVELQ